MTEISETGTPYVPTDFEGKLTRCIYCGHDAPVRDFPRDTPGECSPCFGGRVALQLVTRNETLQLITELQRMVADELQDSVTDDTPV